MQSDVELERYATRSRNPHDHVAVPRAAGAATARVPVRRVADCNAIATRCCDPQDERSGGDGADLGFPGPRHDRTRIRHGVDRRVLDPRDAAERISAPSDEIGFRFRAVVERRVGQDDVAHCEAVEPLEVPPAREVAVQGGVLREVVLSVPAARERDPLPGQVVGRPVTRRVDDLDAVARAQPAVQERDGPRPVVGRVRVVAGVAIDDPEERREVPRGGKEEEGERGASGRQRRRESASTASGSAT